MTYKCVKGHEPMGPAEVTCMDNGEWSLPQFSCVVGKQTVIANSLFLLFGNGILVKEIQTLSG